MTAAEVRAMVQAVVEAHATHNTFYPIWNEAKDRESELTYPCCLWRQYNGKLLRDDNGWFRQQFVEVWIITSVATDRTPVQLQEAVEAADQAATDMVLLMDEDYNYKPENVGIGTVYDEYTTLESGVILRFTCRGAYECLDRSHFPS